MSVGGRWRAISQDGLVFMLRKGCGSLLEGGVGGVGERGLTPKPVIRTRVSLIGVASAIALFVYLCLSVLVLRSNGLDFWVYRSLSHLEGCSRSGTALSAVLGV